METRTRYTGAGWNYGLVLVKRAENASSEDVTLLSEIYYDENGNPESFCEASLDSVEDLEAALRDCRATGMVDWFSQNGQFSYDQDTFSWYWTKKSDVKKSAIAIDFDGVINSYESGFVAIDKIPDEPVAGAFAFIEMLICNQYIVYIHSTRCGNKEAVWSMKDWMRKYGMKEEVLNKLCFTFIKPIAKMYIDDRAYRFDGVYFPSLNDITHFTTWTGHRSSADSGIPECLEHGKSNI